MTVFFEKNRKKLFILLLVFIYIGIFVYNYLTPYLSDDYAYLNETRLANSVFDLMKQQYGEYLSNSGRVIGQFNVRLSLYMGKAVFNVINSLMFLALTLLIYVNIKGKKKYDLLFLILTLTFIFYFAVEFGQTILWICGSCNYLWGSVFILLFLTLFQYFLERADQIRHKKLTAAGMLLLGILAGWCNENTSGGCFLLAALFAANFYYDRRKEKKKGIYPFMITSFLGMLLGLFGMVMAPGVRRRSVTMAEDDTYTGIVGLFSRTYKVIMNMRELFFVLLVLLVIVLVLLVLQKKLDSFTKIRKNNTVLFLIAFLATSFVLALIPTPQNRAFFGAGVFLMLAVLQGIKEVMEDKELMIQALGYGLAAVLSLWLFFTYVDNLVNLARIYREENERIELIREEHGPDGDGIIVIPQFRPEFQTRFSVAHDSDLTEDKTYWINLFYEIYYDIGNITAIPREEWNELYGNK